MDDGKARATAPPTSTAERKLVAEASRARGAELETVIDGTPFMLARLGRDMRYRFISRAYARTISRRSEEVIGTHVAVHALVGMCPPNRSADRIDHNCLTHGGVPR